MLPWIEKYRPQDLKNIILDSETSTIFNNMIKFNYYPNMILYGPPGTGKTTTIMCLLKHYPYSNHIIHLNASDERGIEVIRTQLYAFIHTKGLFQNQMKFIILDEVDSMTKQAQTSLITLLTNTNVRFCLICNYISKLIPSLRDYFLLIPFYNTSNDNSYIKNIIKSENLKLKKSVVDDIIFNYSPDLRSIVNSLQAYQSYPYPLICKKIIKLNCVKYNYTVKQYIKKVCLKDYLVKLFLHMINYNINTDLILMMKDLILVKSDFEYFDKIFMKEYLKQN
jgi:DNA polymerase III delta prime subunit